VLLSSIINTARRHQIWGVIRKMYEFDKEVTKKIYCLKHFSKRSYILNLKFSQMSSMMSLDHRSIYITFLCIIVLFGLLLLLAVFLSYLFLREIIDGEKHFYFAISNIVVNFSMTMCLVTFFLILYCFYARFNLINSCIKKNFAMHENEVGHVSKKKLSKVLSKLILKLANVHDSLVDGTTALNHCFSFQMINIVASLFSTNIFGTFAIYRVFVRKDFANFYQVCIQYSWNIYFLVCGFGIISLASLLTRTGKLTAVLVHKAINYTENDDDPIIDCVSYFDQVD
jgi:hypothetical protein